MLPRVVILGGGAAGMTAAMELTRPGWRERYSSVTLYQHGWRLGGKGASGRGGPHARIEEHGLHIWLGFYANAFRMLRECYEELDRDESSPIRTLGEAFERASLFIVQEPRGDGWAQWPAQFSESDELPGDRSVELPSLWELLVRGLRLAIAYHRSAQGSVATLTGPVVTLRPEPVPQRERTVTLAPAPEPAAARLFSGVRDLSLKAWHFGSDARQLGLALALEYAGGLPSDPADHERHQHHRLRMLIEQALGLNRRPDEVSDEARREWYLIDIILAAIRGVLADGVLLHPDQLDSIDHIDFVDWLIQHGADPEAARCGLVTTLMYDLPFSYQDGDPRKPSIAAGTALRGALRTLFTYQGAIAWKMRAGMGDIMFAPMYEVLERRGVKFEFFHRVEALHPDEDGLRVASIDLSRQAKLKDPAAGYRPFPPLVNGLPCWPSAPLNEQLETPLTAEEAESFWSQAPVEPVTLEAGKDFDKVVLAIPVGAHPYLCSELMALNARWKAMADKLGTVYTQAFQLWLSADMAQLGYRGPQATIGGYLEPFDTIADMRQLIPRELWADGEVGAIAYFCNVMLTPEKLPSREDTHVPQRADEHVKANALLFLREAMAPLWPEGVHRYPTDFRWDLLVDDERRSGPARFDSQFWRANVDPSERYVQALPGTSRYRLAPHESGFDNLVFAGDWTRCALNSGCVEAAVISGLLAAAAVEGGPPRRHIIGVRDQGGRHAF